MVTVLVYCDEFQLTSMSGLMRKFLNLLILLFAASWVPNVIAQSALPTHVQADLLQKKILQSLKAEKLDRVLLDIDELKALGSDFPTPLLWVEARAAYSLGRYELAYKALIEYLEKADPSSREYMQAIGRYDEYEEKSNALLEEKERQLFLAMDNQEMLSRAWREIYDEEDVDDVKNIRNLLLNGMDVSEPYAEFGSLVYHAIQLRDRNGLELALLMSEDLNFDFASFTGPAGEAPKLGRNKVSELSIEEMLNVARLILKSQTPKEQLLVTIYSEWPFELKDRLVLLDEGLIKPEDISGETGSSVVESLVYKYRQSLSIDPDDAYRELHAFLSIGAQAGYKGKSHFFTSTSYVIAESLLGAICSPPSCKIDYQSFISPSAAKLLLEFGWEPNLDPFWQALLLPDGVIKFFTDFSCNAGEREQGPGYQSSASGEEAQIALELVSLPNLGPSIVTIKKLEKEIEKFQRRHRENEAKLVELQGSFCLAVLNRANRSQEN